MDPTRTIEKLLTSWNTQARQMGFEENCPITKTLLKQLFLTTRAGEIEFAQKPQQKPLARLMKVFKGEKESDSFREQMHKIKHLYSLIVESVDEPQKKTLLSFEERINALGQYVFSSRHKKTLFCCDGPKFIAFQVRYSLPQTLIKPDSIKRGLKNSDASRCWLNSSIKFMAGTELYDQILCTPQKEISLERQRLALFRLVEALRKNWDQPVINSLYDELVDELRQSPFRSYFARQQDADEFLLSLQGHFAHDPKLAPAIEMIELYKPMTDDPNVYKNGKTLAQPRMEIVHSLEPTIDIERCFMTPCVSEQPIKEYHIHQDSALIKSQQVQADPLNFKHQLCVIHYPDNLQVSLSRGDSYAGHVSSKKVRFDEGGTIVLTEYEPEYNQVADHELLLDVRPKNRCTFQVVAAIERRGSTNEFGHFIAHTRDLQGAITSHSDMQVASNRSEEVWANSYYFLLKLIERSPI